MDLLLGTLLLRPYVFGFLAAFLAAGAADIGWRRTLLFGGVVWPLAWLAEFSSTRAGVPFGLYHYTGATRGQELFLADVPFMDSLSFTFLAYAAFCLARLARGAAGAARGGSDAEAPPSPGLAVLAGFLMMALDVVIDPLAVRGDRWFLGRIFYYPHGGVYFGVPLSNFLGWWLMGTAGVLAYRFAGGTTGRRPGGGVALYYAVLAFNLALTVWIGERALAAIGLALHALLGLSLLLVSRPEEDAAATVAERGMGRV
jgi:putative membrane protein